MRFFCIASPTLAALSLFLGSCQPLGAATTDAGPPDASADAATPFEDASPNDNAFTNRTNFNARTTAMTDAGLDAATTDVDAGDDGGSDAGNDGGSDAGVVAPCPDEMAHMGRYCVDRWEAHLVTTNLDGTTTPWPHFDRPEQDTHYEARSASGVYPQGYISRVEAAQACKNAGKRLCSRSEWMHACKGKRGFRYPYANKGKRGACNTGKIHLLQEFFGLRPGGWTYENFNDPKLHHQPGFLAKTGEYEACHSPEGVFDMVGNLHEWTSDKVRSDIELVLEKDAVERKKQPWRVGNAIFMGGFFSTTIEHGPGCVYTTIAHEPTYHDYSTGFRCCKNAILPPKPPKTQIKSTGTKKKRPQPP